MAKVKFSNRSGFHVMSEIRAVTEAVTIDNISSNYENLNHIV